MSDTPETDHLFDLDNMQYQRDLAMKVLKRLERERDEALSQIVQAECRAERFCQERDEAREEIQILRLDAQREAEHHDRLVKELENLYDKLKSQRS